MFDLDRTLLPGSSLLALARSLRSRKLLSVQQSQVLPGGRLLLRRHQDGGDFVVVLSASPQELVQVVATAVGAHRAIGTRAECIDGRYTGRLLEPFCYGSGKLVRLRQDLGPGVLDQATAYADSSSDLPVLEASREPVAVNPDRPLLRVVRPRMAGTATPLTRPPGRASSRCHRSFCRRPLRVGRLVMSGSYGPLHAARS